ncbi:MAG: hypothetical protein KF868_18770 [Acidobacteria bacterium]|nr:hypothetical protein [Acidobacteriota bacterium]MCW5967500.1 hypothetical protein [Blastocatellales bacterium]
MGLSACTGDKGESPAPAATPAESPTPVAAPEADGSGEVGVSPAAAAPASGSSATSMAGGGSPGGSAPVGGAGAPAPSAAAPAQAPPPPPPTPHTYTIRPGTQLRIYTAQALSTKSNKAGDTFVGSLANAIVDGDWVVAKRGAEVSGVITRADEGGRVKDVASITVELNRLTLADGRTISLNTTPYTQEARSTKKKDAAKIGVGAGIGAAIGGIAGGGKGAAIGAGVGGGAGTGVVLATKGDPAVIPGEAAITFRVTSPVTVTRQQ